MKTNIEQQREEFEKIYSADISRFAFHTTDDPLVRFLRDRRLKKGTSFLKKKYPDAELKTWRVLVVCGGVGGEGLFFLREGFTDVTSTDFSENSLNIARQLSNNNGLKTLWLNAEKIDLPDNSYDLVVVQDGLHHLSRPTLGFTEMLRVASKAIIVIEPYDSIVGSLMGTEWEKHDNAVNFVYRWNYKMVKQIVKSYLLTSYSAIKVFRLWDHNVVIGKITKVVPSAYRLNFAKILYAFLNCVNSTGNMMVCVVIK